MFEVKCLRTGKSLTLDQTTVLIVLREFANGYEMFFEICSSDIGTITDIVDCSGSLLYTIEHIK